QCPSQASRSESGSYRNLTTSKRPPSSQLITDWFNHPSIPSPLYSLPYPTLLTPIVDAVCASIAQVPLPPLRRLIE
ncbi:hypothetical protein BgiBS90_009840, partial [Biomphalaria glabrata]